MPEFAFQEMFPVPKDPTTPWKKLGADGVSTGTYKGQRVLEVDGAALSGLTAAA